MPELDDFEMDPAARGDEDDGPTLRSPRSGFPYGVAALIAILVLLAAAGGYVVFRRSGAGTPIPSPSPVERPTPPVPSPVPSPEGSPLPSLDTSDALFRELARTLSSHPALATWLEAQDLVRRIASAVEALAAGGSPAPHLGFLQPEGTFRVLQREGRLVIDPRSFARYDALGAVIGSLDASATASVFHRLEPLFEAAYRERGHAGGFREALGRAIGILLATPVPKGDVPVRPVMRATLVYEYEDPGLEALAPAQKHLLRTGSANAGKVQAKLRELAAALGVEARVTPP